MSKTGVVKAGTEQGVRRRGAAKLRLAPQLPPGESLGIQSGPGFVRAPAGHGAAERGIRTGQQHLLRTACCESVADRRLALQQWRYTAQWFVRRHGHRSPEQVLQVLFDFGVAA